MSDLLFSMDTLELQISWLDSVIEDVWEEEDCLEEEEDSEDEEELKLLLHVEISLLYLVCLSAELSLDRRE